MNGNRQLPLSEHNKACKQYAAANHRREKWALWAIRLSIAALLTSIFVPEGVQLGLSLVPALLLPVGMVTFTPHFLRLIKDTWIAGKYDSIAFGIYWFSALYFFLLLTAWSKLDGLKIAVIVTFTGIQLSGAYVWYCIFYSKARKAMTGDSLSGLLRDGIHGIVDLYRKK
jgi:hypothetical protein